MLYFQLAFPKSTTNPLSSNYNQFCLFSGPKSKLSTSIEVLVAYRRLVCRLDTCKMSSYNRWVAQTGYETAAMHIDRALERTKGLKIDAEFVTTNDYVAVSNVNPSHTSNPFRYQIYQLGYEPGDEIVSLPSAQANPPPVHNQFMHTSPHTYENAFVGTDLPPILFRLEPFRDDFIDIKVPTLCDASTGQPVVTNRGQTLRYFSFLPRYISWNVPGSLLEFWFRLDYRLEMNDIIMRIESGPSWRPERLQAARNAQQMKRNRFRDELGLTAWSFSRTFPQRTDVDSVGRASPEQVCFNTKMIVDLPNKRLLKPMFRDLQCTRPFGFVDSDLNLDYYLSNLVNTVPSRRMIATIELRHRLQRLARVRGLGTDSGSWKRLSRADEPHWWNNKTADHTLEDDRTFDELNGRGMGKTHEEWIAERFGHSMGVGVAKRARTRVSTLQENNRRSP